MHRQKWVRSRTRSIGGEATDRADTPERKPAPASCTIQRGSRGGSQSPSAQARAGFKAGVIPHLDLRANAAQLARACRIELCLETCIDRHLSWRSANAGGEKKLCCALRRPIRRAVR